ncbi:MAG: S-layer homology domain-containing protein [Oscillospiraceae bacterium]|nr:S-layer homology domain-containing protein [Oscillospiraceae bacterium]
MKKLISLLLVLGLLCSLCVSFASAEETPEIGQEQLDRILSFVDRDELPERQEPPVQRAARAKNRSLITAAPLFESVSCVYGQPMPIRTLMFPEGNPEDVYFIAIYESLNDLDQEPLDYGVDYFGEDQEIYGLELQWTGYMDLKLSSFVVVMFTAIDNGENLIAVEGSDSYIEAKVVQQHMPAKELKLYSFDQSQGAGALDKIAVTLDDLDYYFAHVETDPCTSPAELTLTYDKNILDVKQLYGLLSVTASEYGWTSLKIGLEQAALEIPVEICSQPGGHTMLEPEIIREPTEEENGITRYACGNCGAYYEERTWLRDPVFIQFKDVEELSWYCDAVQFVVDRGLFNGVSDTLFAPQRTMTRAMLVTVLYRYSQEKVEAESLFEDVPTDLWYSEAVTWAQQNGIVNGVGKGRFNPDGTITREQLATILYRYAQSMGVDTEARAELNFPDLDQLSSWATEAMQWAVAEGLISGSGSGSNVKLLPRDGATRAQVATVLMRFIQAQQTETAPDTETEG